MEFYGSEDVKCLCGAPNCRGTLGKKDESDKGKGKAVARKSGPAVTAKSLAKSKAGASAASVSKGKCGKQCPGAGRKTNTEMQQAGGKRKEPEAAAGEEEEDEFFSSLSAREKRKQLEKMKTMAKTAAVKRK